MARRLDRTLRFVGFMVVLAIVAAGCFNTALRTGSLSGVVRSDLYGPFEVAVVTLVELEKSVTTDADGAFRFEDITFGTYTLVVMKDGEEIWSQKVTVKAKEETVDVFIQYNLIPNGDFSQGTKSDGYPVGWTRAGGSANHYIELSNVRASVGTHSVRFVSGSTGTPMGLRSDMVPAEPGAVYRLDVDVWSVNATEIRIYLEFYSADNEKSTATSVLRGDDLVHNQWLTMTAQGEAPANTANLAVYLYSSSANVGEMFFDNVRVVKVVE